MSRGQRVLQAEEAPEPQDAAQALQGVLGKPQESGRWAGGQDGATRGQDERRPQAGRLPRVQNDHDRGHLQLREG